PTRPFRLLSPSPSSPPYFHRRSFPASYRCRHPCFCPYHCQGPSFSGRSGPHLLCPGLECPCHFSPGCSSLRHLATRLALATPPSAPRDVVQASSVRASSWPPYLSFCPRRTSLSCLSDGSDSPSFCL